MSDKQEYTSKNTILTEPIDNNIKPPILRRSNATRPYAEPNQLENTTEKKKEEKHIIDILEEYRGQSDRTICIV